MVSGGLHLPTAAVVLAFGIVLAAGWLLWRRRPDLVFVQNPSLILAALTVKWGRLSGASVVMDAHNAGIEPFDGRSRWASRLAAYAMRHAALTIVSNAGLSPRVGEHGGRPVVLPDPLPPLTPPAAAERLEGRLNLLFICTWASDEPYLEVLRAAAMLDPQIRIYITGNSRGRERGLQGPLPPNVVLTGYVAEPEFQRLLFSCDAVMDLTTRENCLLCGAYEATAAERPMLLSDTRCLRDYFDRGAVYADNTAAGIAAAVRELDRRYDDLCAQIKALRVERAEQWQQRLLGLERALVMIRSRPR